jgi:glycosyltransferase involved in cell wall biosynthesis
MQSLQRLVGLRSTRSAAADSGVEDVKILISANVVWWNASAYYAIAAAQALSERGHDVTVLTHRSTPAFQQARDRGLKVEGEFQLLSRNPLQFWGIQRSLRAWLKRENFDLINPHRPEDHFHLALANRKLKNRAALVRTVSDVRIPAANPFNHWLHQKWTDGLIYCAECAHSRYHQGLRLESKTEKVIYSALDVEAYRAGDWKKDNRFAESPSPRIAIVARLSPNKGHRDLIEAAAKILPQIPTATFVVAGKEEEVSIAELKEYAHQHGVEKSFVFAGHLEDPRQVIAASDIGVIASTESEVISRAAQEFFAFAVPVVASRVNVLPEMVQDGFNGLLFNPGDAAGLAAALRRLAADEPSRKQMGERALGRARQHHDLSVLGGETETFFNRVLAMAREPKRASGQKA